MGFDLFGEVLDILLGLLEELDILLLFAYPHVDGLQHNSYLLRFEIDVGLDSVWIGVIEPLVDLVELISHLYVLLCRDVLLVDGR